MMLLEVCACSVIETDFIEPNKVTPERFKSDKLQIDRHALVVEGECRLINVLLYKVHNHS